VILQAGAQHTSLTSRGAEGIKRRSAEVQASEEMRETAACSGFVVEKEEQESLVNAS
jgi:hypothetical protein